MNDLAHRFRRLYGTEPQLFRAPGRVNLIGEHTDYNDGLVMPVALQFETRVAIAPRADHRLCLRSANVEESFEVEVPADFAATPPPPRAGAWHDYVVGVVWALGRAGLPVPAANVLLEGNVPLGAGLSSSASLEVAIAWALLSLGGRVPEPMQVAQLCQQAENEHVGTRCGLMDQFAAAHGRAGHALLFDCRSLDWAPLAVGDAVIVICNSGVKHSLAGGEYNRRREDCEAGVAALTAWRHRTNPALPAPGTLRDVTLAELDAAAPEMDPVVVRRCRHVITENARVEAMRTALQSGDLVAAGHLMADSHASLRDDYAVSCAELDVLVSLAQRFAAGTVAGTPTCYGARMTGGGFGGCTVNLVAPAAVAAFRDAVASGYLEATGRRAEIHVGRASDGAGALA